MSERADLERQLDAIVVEAESLLSGLSEAQVNWRPAADRWSVGDCLSHLDTGIRTAMPALDAAIDTARARGWTGQGPLRYGWFARWMVRSQEPPVTRRVRTFPVFFPAQGPHDVTALRAGFRATRDALRERLARAEGLDWKRARVVSPASRFFRLPFGAYVAFLLAHDRRHLWQARGVKAHPDFPR
jgi:hypothetical protein